MFLEDLSQFSLQSLRVFAHVASMGSVVEAAGAMELTQPAVSLQIQNLEKQLGFHLFERQGRRNILTARGQAFYQKLLPNLENLEQVLSEAQNTEASHRPELNIGSVEGIGEYWLWTRFNDFSRSHENLRLRLQIFEAQPLEERLVTGQVSVVITPRKIEHPQVVSRVLMDERLLPVGTEKAIQNLKEALEAKPGKGDEAEDFRNWERVQWIGYGDYSNSDRWALRWLESMGIVVDRRFRYQHLVNSYSVIRQLLIEGRGVCVAPEHVVETELASKVLQSLESKKYPALKNRMYISHREGSGLSQIHQEFIEWIVKTASENDKS